MSKSILDSNTELGAALLSFRNTFFQIGAFSFFINLLMLAPALYMMQVYSRVLPSSNENTLLMLTILVLSLFLLYGLLEWVRAKVLVRVGTKIDIMLHERAFNAAFYRNVSRQGESPAQAIQDLTNIRHFFAGPGVLAFFDAPWIPIFIGVIYLLHPWLGTFALVAVILLFILAVFNEVYTRPPLDEAYEQSNRANLYANNNLRNAEAIEVMGMLQSVYKLWQRHQHKFLALQALASDRSAVVNSLMKVMRLLAQSGIIGVAAWLAINGEIEMGALIGAMILMGRALMPVEQIISAWRQWGSTKASYERLGALLENFPDEKDKMDLPSPEGCLSVENISVIPPGAEHEVLKQVSFMINKGDVVGVLGSSASGKSTLARVMLGLWEASEGNVRLDGMDIYEWSKKQLGSSLGYLPQDIELLEGTVAENIARFGVLDAEKVVEAAKNADIHEMVLRLPQGYDSQLGVGGVNLSAGQRQRLALARAIYDNPTFIVLDEPNSNLDEVGEIALVKAIEKLKENGSTIVLITHKKNVLTVVDKLLVMKDGSLFLYGPKDQVIEHLYNKTGSNKISNQSSSENKEEGE